MKMNRKNLSIRRTRIDDLLPVGTTLSEENIRSVAGGGSFALRKFQVARQATKSEYDFSDEPILVSGGCTTSLTENSCD